MVGYMTTQATSRSAEVAVSAEQPLVVDISSDGCQHQSQAEDLSSSISAKEGEKRGGGGSVTSAAKCAVPGHPNLDVIRLKVCGRFATLLEEEKGLPR